MPWTVDDPPNPAQNWTDKEKERCVAAANAVLRDGGTDEEAIFACIHNAGKGDNSMTREYKSFDSFEVKLDADLGIVEHLVSIFGVVDLTNDIVHPGSFQKTLLERGGKVLVLDNHRMEGHKSILGKPLVIREVGRSELPKSLTDQYPDASGGLWAQTQFAMNTQAGREAFELIKMGALQEWSFAYDVIQKDYTDIEIAGEKQNIRNLREVKLYEYSPVLIGANSATMTTGVKSEDVPEAEPEAPPEDSPSIVNFNIVIPEGMKGMNADEFIALVTKAFEQASPIEPAVDADTEPTTEAKAEPDTPEAGPSPETPTSDDVAPLTLDVDRIKSVVDVELEIIDLMLLDI